AARTPAQRLCGPEPHPTGHPAAEILGSQNLGPAARNPACRRTTASPCADRSTLHLRDVPAAASEGAHPRLPKPACFRRGPAAATAAASPGTGPAEPKPPCPASATERGCESA